MYCFICLLESEIKLLLIIGPHPSPDKWLAVVAVVHQELNRLLDGPAHGVDPSVHHQSAGSEHFSLQHAKPHQWILIEAKLVAQ